MFHGRSSECSTQQGLIDEILPLLGETRKGTCVKPPETVKSVPRPENNLFVVKSLMNSNKLVHIFVREGKILVAKYIIDDVSGTGFGSSSTTLMLKMKYRFVVWDLMRKQKVLISKS